MKKIIALLLVLVMSLGLFAGCGEKPADTSGLDAAAEYLYAMYKEEDGTKQTVNFSRVGVVMIDGVSYTIDWTVNVLSGDEGIVTVEDNGDKTVTVKISDAVANETSVELVASIKDAEGNSKEVKFSHVVPKVPTAAEILDMAYALDSGAAMEGTYKLTGVITNIDTPWDDGYKNITVTIVVDGDTARPVMCYRLTSGTTTDASKLAVGDTITVSGTIKNYNGTVEFDAKCVLLNVVPGEGSSTVEPAEGFDPTGKTVEEIINAAYALESGAAFTAPATLTGKVVSVDTPYSEQYGNVTVTIQVEGFESKPIQCFRMKGTGADTVKAGDTITVTGTIKNYNGTIEYDAGCTLDKLVVGEGGDVDVDAPVTDPAADSTLTIAEAIALGKSKEHNTYTEGKYYVSGVITEIYNTQYGNMKISDSNGNILTIYGTYSADGSTRFDAMTNQPAVGATVKIYGIVGQYNGTAQIKNGWIVEQSGTSTTPDPEPTPDPSSEPACVTNPEIGKAYKLGLWQSNKSAVYYFTGAMSGYYGATETDKALAVDVYLEDAGDGAFYIYFMSGSTKSYLYGEQSGTHLNFKFGSTKGVFTWNAEYNTLMTTIGDTVVFMGTYSNYVTFGMSKEDKIATSYAAHLYN